MRAPRHPSDYAGQWGLEGHAAARDPLATDRFGSSAAVIGLRGRPPADLRVNRRARQNGRCDALENQSGDNCGTPSVSDGGPRPRRRRVHAIRGEGRNRINDHAPPRLRECLRQGLELRHRLRRQPDEDRLVVNQSLARADTRRRAARPPAGLALPRGSPSEWACASHRPPW